MNRRLRLLRALPAILAALLLPAAARPAAAQAAPAAAPDVLVFTNGDQLSGKFVRNEGDSVLFHSDMAGDLTIPMAKVKELRPAGQFAVLTKDAQKKKKMPIISGPIEESQDALKVTPAGASTETIPPAQIGFVIDQPTYDQQVAHQPGFLHGWKGTMSAGATFVRSTDTGETFTLGTSLVRAIPVVGYLPKRNRTLFNLAETYGKLSTPTIPQTTPPTPLATAKTSIFHTDAERDEYFSPRFYGLADTSFDHNFSQGLNLQEVYGAGVGWTAIDTPKQNLDLRVDIHYEKQQFQTASNDTNLIGSMISENYLRHLPAKILFTETANFLPAFNDPKAYSANASAGIGMQLFKRLGASFNATDNYLNNPSAGYKKNSFQFVTALTYTLP